MLFLQKTIVLYNLGHGPVFRALAVWVASQSASAAGGEYTEFTSKKWGTLKRDFTQNPRNSTRGSE